MDSALIASLARDLTAAGFTVDRLTELWGEDAAAALHRGHRLPALRALDRAASSPAATLARAFVLGFPSTAQELEAALPATGFAGARALGLVDDSAAPLLDLRPYSVVDGHGVVSWWIVSDLGELALGHAIPEHHVLGVGGASMTLSGLLVDLAVDTALDLGTGCGIQAMHVARHATRVVATDISQRALDLAAFNAELNGFDNIEFRLGSLFEPVAGERFGHIVSNPPFVITPRTSGVPSYEYRDGGMVGDALVASVVAGLEEHLEPGGVAQLLGNWEYRDEPGLDRVRGWIEATGLDAWVVERERQDVEQYAETWIRDGGTRAGTEFDALSAAWLDDFEARDVREVGFGYLTLRRPENGEPTLRRFEEYGAPLGGSLGDHIAAVLSAHDWLESASLRDARLTVAPDVTEERHYWPGADDPTVMILRQGSGFARSIPIGTAVAAVVGASDGDLSVEAICFAVADILQVDAQALLDEVLPELRELVVTGFLHP